MNPSQKPPRGLRRALKVGLAVALIALVIETLLIPRPKPSPEPALDKSVAYHHTPPPAGAGPPRIDPRPARPIAVVLTDAPPMTIDAEELARAGRERSDNALIMTFCWCPPGKLSMGGGPKGPSGRYLDGPPAEVTIRHGYWMGKYEVTQAQWQRVMGRSLAQQRATGPSQPRPLGDGTTREHAGLGPDHPIYFTSYLDAEDFCDRLTRAERAGGRLEPGWAYRLPTESQWEYACRAGTTTATPFGDRLGSDRANFDWTAAFNNGPTGPFLRTTTRVGSFPANAWGMHDMLGNVWEWCRDDNLLVPEPAMPGGARRAAVERRPWRGGCWYEPGHHCLPTSRQRGPLNARGSGLGFRVALVASELGIDAQSGGRPGSPEGPEPRDRRTGALEEKAR